MSKRTITRQWLNTDKSNPSTIITETDEHGAHVSISDCSSRISLHMDNAPLSYETGKPNRAAINRYKKKLNLVISTLLDQMMEMDRRWP